MDSEKRSPLLFYVTGEDGNIVPQKILEQQDIRIYQEMEGSVNTLHTFTFDPVFLRTLSSSDQIYTIWTEDFLVKVYSPEGEYLRSFYYPFEKRELIPSELTERESFNETKQQILGTIEIPDTWPVIRSMFMDDEDRLWISPYPAEAGYTWWVLSDSGEMLGQIQLPGNQRLREVKNGQIYVIENETETGEQVVIRYQMETGGI